MFAGEAEAEYKMQGPHTDITRRIKDLQNTGNASFKAPPISGTGRRVHRM